MRSNSENSVQALKSQLDKLMKEDKYFSSFFNQISINRSANGQPTLEIELAYGHRSLRNTLSDLRLNLNASEHPSPVSLEINTASRDKMIVNDCDAFLAALRNRARKIEVQNNLTQRLNDAIPSAAPNDTCRFQALPNGNICLTSPHAYDGMQSMLRFVEEKLPGAALRSELHNGTGYVFIEPKHFATLTNNFQAQATLVRDEKVDDSMMARLSTQLANLIKTDPAFASVFNKVSLQKDDKGAPKIGVEISYGSSGSMQRLFNSIQLPINTNKYPAPVSLEDNLIKRDKIIINDVDAFITALQQRAHLKETQNNLVNYLNSAAAAIAPKDGCKFIAKMDGSITMTSPNGYGGVIAMSDFIKKTIPGANTNMSLHNGAGHLDIPQRDVVALTTKLQTQSVAQNRGFIVGGQRAALNRGQSGIATTQLDAPSEQSQSESTPRFRR